MCFVDAYDDVFSCRYLPLPCHVCGFRALQLPTVTSRRFALFVKTQRFNDRMRILLIGRLTAVPF